MNKKVLSPIIVIAFALLLTAPVYASPCHITVCKLVTGEAPDEEFIIMFEDESHIFVNGTCKTFQLNPGNYTVEELVPKGWILVDIDIEDPTEDSYTQGDTAYIDLSDEGVTVTFINRYRSVGGQVTANSILPRLALVVSASGLIIVGIIYAIGIVVRASRRKTVET